MKKLLFILLINCFTFHFLSAQLEGVRVETYYVSDANDATDTLGGMLEVGTTTYRIYMDLVTGSRLLKIYGDENHSLSFSSTEPFFNHREDGETFGKDINKNRYEDGTIALDTWLTIGQASRPFASGAYMGVPKEKDTDGSIVGGENNDGGSAEIPEGLLTNNAPDAGIALTEADGIMLVDQALPDGWVDIDFINPLSGEDTTIFGSDTITEFTSNSASFFNSGTTGVFPDENEVLVAQLTTKGELSFTINVEVEFEEDGETKTIKYVSNEAMVMNGEEFNPLLSFPWTCGCKDPDFLEASPSFACEDNSLCLTPVVYGCLDSLACNYDEAANFNIEDLCCYVGYCNDRDISVVCPDLPEFRLKPTEHSIQIYPNPTEGIFYTTLDFPYENAIPFSIFDAYGRQRWHSALRDINQEVDISFLERGIYYVRFLVDDTILTKPISVY